MRSPKVGSFRSNRFRFRLRQCECWAGSTGSIASGVFATLWQIRYAPPIEKLAFLFLLAAGKWSCSFDYASIYCIGMRTKAATRIAIAAIFISGLSLFFRFPSPLQAIAGILLSYALPGLVLLLFLGQNRPAGLPQLVATPLLSPIVLCLLSIAFQKLSGSFETSVISSVLILEAFLAAAILFKKYETKDETPNAFDKAASILSISFAGVVLLSFLLNHTLLMRSDAWYHASVVSEILDRGIPPFEPWLPDVPIRYMWFYHLFVAATVKLTGLGVFASLGVFNIVAAAIFPYLTSQLVSHFVSDRRQRFLTTLLALAGLQAAAWIFFPFDFARALVGENRGWSEVANIISNIDINSFRVIYFLSPFESMQRFGNYMINLQDKFLTLTAFGFSLDIFLLAYLVALSKKDLEKNPTKTALFLFFLCLDALLFHSIIGMTLILVIIGASIFSKLSGTIGIFSRESAKHSILMPISAFAAAACGLPYLLSLTAGGSPANTGFIHFGTRNLLTMILPLVPLFRPTIAAMKELIKGKNQDTRTAASWLASLTVLCIFANLPTRNESKLLFPFFLVFSPLVLANFALASSSISRARRIGFVAVVLILFAAPAILTVRGFILDRPTNPIEARRASITAEDRELFEWIAENTPKETVVLERNKENMMPVYARRRNFFPDPGTINVFGYGGAKVESYRKVRDNLFSRSPIPGSDIETLERIGKPVLVLVWRKDLLEHPWLESRFSALRDWFEEVYRNPSATAYRYKTSDSMHEIGKERPK